jgi:hypothetical protein
VADNVMVAGRAAYQLTLAPKSAQSLVGQVAVAIDARTHLPLRVQVTARGSATPVFSAGYTSISFATPAASNFTFTPPPGAKVKQATLGGAGGPLGGLLGGAPFGGIPFGGGPPRVRIPSSGMPAKLCSPASAQPGQHCTVLPPGTQLPKGMPLGRGAPEFGKAKLGTGHKRNLGWYAYSPMTGQTYTPHNGTASQGQVIGTGWTAVRVLAAPGLSGNAANQVGGPLKALLNAATPVHGSWGSGRLLRTSLLSVLITSQGQVLIGAVTPGLLYTDVAQARSSAAVTP